jgi:hypothetical protein
MFRVTLCAYMAALLAGAGASGAAGDDAQADQWPGTYHDAQVILELIAKPAGDYEGKILFKGQTFPLTARGQAGQLSGTFRTADGSFDFTLTRSGDAVNLATGGKTYHLKSPATNPLAAGTPTSNPAAADTGSGPPTLYSVVASTESGKKLFVHKAEAKSVPAALGSALQDLSRWFDAKPNATGAFADAKEHRRGGAPFTATLKGQPIKGLVFCTLGDNGADITVTYCLASAPASEWAKLGSSGETTASASPPGIKLEQYDFPDGTGSIQLPAGWKTSARTCIQGVRIAGPAGQWVTLGQSYSVNMPKSFIVQNQLELAEQARRMGLPPPKQIEMFVAPYSGPADALKNLMPQISRMSQTHGGPAVRLDKFLEEPKPAQASFPNGQAAELCFAVVRTAEGVSTRYRSRARVETWVVGTGAWSMYFTELAAPEASFDKDLPTMLAIAHSLRMNSQAVQRETSRAIDAQNTNFRALQRAHATQQQAFDDYFKSLQHNSLIRDRSITDFDEVIRGVRTVEDTRTGERTSVDLGNVDQIVDRLNAHDPGRYVQIPLRDELFPVPAEQKR